MLDVVEVKGQEPVGQAVVGHAVSGTQPLTKQDTARGCMAWHVGGGGQGVVVRVRG